MQITFNVSDDIARQFAITPEGVTCSLRREGGEASISFFGGLDFNRVRDPLSANGGDWR